MTTDGGQLKVAATDLELGVTTHIGAKVRQAGTVTLPARLLVDFVGNNPDETITITTDGAQATLTSDHHTASLNGMDASEFPLIPPPGKTAAVTLPALALKRLLGDVLYAAAIDDARPVLGGVFLRLTDKTLVGAATDSYRLAERTIPLQAAAATPLDLIVPTRSVAEIIRVLPDDERPVDLAKTEHQLSLVFESTQIVSRLVDGTFPDYHQIIPSEATTVVTVARSELVAAVKMADLFARDAAHHIRWQSGPDTGVTLRATSSAAGQNETTVDGTVTGEACQIAFNAKYLLDALGVIKTEQVQIGLVGPDRPGVLRGVGDDHSLGLVMPLRLDA